MAKPLTKKMTDKIQWHLRNESLLPIMIRECEEEILHSGFGIDFTNTKVRTSGYADSTAKRAEKLIQTVDGYKKWIWVTSEARTYFADKPEIEFWRHRYHLKLTFREIAKALHMSASPLHGYEYNILTYCALLATTKGLFRAEDLTKNHGDA